ncbi:unnamed protein product, partial [Urochloa humidicola]
AAPERAGVQFPVSEIHDGGSLLPPREYATWLGLPSVGTCGILIHSLGLLPPRGAVLGAAAGTTTPGVATSPGTGARDPFPCHLDGGDAATCHLRPPQSALHPGPRTLLAARRQPTLHLHACYVAAGKSFLIRRGGWSSLLAIVP